MRYSVWFYVHLIAMVTLALLVPYEFQRHAWGWVGVESFSLVANLVGAVKELLEPSP